MALDVRTQITTAEQTVLEILELGLQVRLAPVADTAALAAAAVTTTRDRALRYVTAENRVYRWSAASTAAHAPPNVVQPQAAPPNGRWLRVTSPSTFGPNLNAPLHSRQTGYVRWVRLYQGPDTLDDQQVGVDGQTPALLIHWVGDRPEARSNRPGALYWNVHDFQVQCLSSCLRPPPATRWGSPIPAELAQDPGLHRLMGDVRYLLAGVDVGEPGIESIEIGAGAIVDEDLEERLHVGQVQVLVRTSWRIPDEDLADMALQVNPKWTDFQDPPRFDPLNYVASGYIIQVGAGLTRTPAPGSAFIAGVALSSSPAARTFSADRDTYRDLKPDGTFTYLEVAVGAKPPAVTAGALRVGVTTTNGADIIQDKILCSYSVPFWAPAGSMAIP
jgi:hypothetical protein